MNKKIILTAFQDLFNLCSETFRDPRRMSRRERSLFFSASSVIMTHPMSGSDAMARAVELLQEAYQKQMSGDLDSAVELYRESVQTFPTAEAHTFLGWTYSFQGRLNEAIEQCKRAIQIDPDFGNPYNDIGAYLIELGQLDEAVPWLEKAIEAKRYDSYHYPYCNLGRVFLAKEVYSKAMQCFEQALEIAPDYLPAKRALERLKRTIQ